MDRVLQIDEFQRFNGFYRKSECRAVVLKLYKGVCQFCNGPIEGNTFHVAHVIARTHPELMEEYLPGLDVDNLLNLQLSCPTCNLKASNFVVESPFLLMRAFTVSARVISQRWHLIEEQLRSKDNAPIGMSSIDPKICGGVLHLDTEALQEMASGWHDAVLISNDKFRHCIRQRYAKVFGHEPDRGVVSATVDEAVGYFEDTVQIDGSCMKATSGKSPPAWWADAQERYRVRVEQRRSGTVDDNGVAGDFGLPDGIYLDPREIEYRQGVWVPLRTETQQWFYDVFSTLLWLQRDLESRTEGGRYVVLDEWRWRSIQECHWRLGNVGAGLGRAIARDLKGPEMVAQFTVSNGKLYLDDQATEIPTEVKRLCVLTGNTPIWGNGSVLRRSNLKSWLKRAFALADIGVQKAVGPYLVQVDGWRWVPFLPETEGKTREQLRNELADAAAFRRKKGRRTAKAAEWVSP